MSFLFRSRSRGRSPEHSLEASGSSRKIVRARRRGPPASPYARPLPLLPAPPGSAESASPGGFLGFLRGAGRAISSVFWSESSSETSESGSDEESGSGDDEDSHPPKALPQLTQRRENSELVNNALEEARAVVPISETKLSIQNLLMQETFSRDECDKLKKLIETRVVDSSAVEFTYKGRDTSEMNADKAVSSSGFQQSLNQNIELPKSASYSPSYMGVFSSKSPQFGSPDIRSTALIEAKKWLKEKKTTLPSKSDLFYGPYTLNNDMLHYGTEDEINSPADLAKSYMSSIPPWQSPSMSSSDLVSPPSSLRSLYKDENRDESSLSLPPFKVFKRKYLSSRLLESTADARRLRLRSTDETVEPKLEKFDLSEAYFQSNTMKIPPAADENESKLSAVNPDSTSLPGAKTSNVTSKLCEELHCEIHGTEACRLHGGTSVKLTDSTIAHKTTPVFTTSGPDETCKSVDSTSDALALNTLEHTHSFPESIPKLLRSPDDNKDVQLPHTRKDAIFDNHLGTLRHTSKLVEHDGNSLPELKAAISEGVVSNKQSNANGSSSPANERVNSVGRSVPDDTLMLNNSGGQNLDSETKLHDAHPPVENEVNGCLIESSANDSAAKSNVGSDDGMDNADRTGSKNGGVPEGPFELPAENEVETPVDFDMPSPSVSSKKGSRKRSVGQGLAEPSPRVSTRTRRVVAKVKRGRGRPKGSSTG